MIACVARVQMFAAVAAVEFYYDFAMLHSFVVDAVVIATPIPFPNLKLEEKN
jgi:hypothetical protein